MRRPYIHKVKVTGELIHDTDPLSVQVSVDEGGTATHSTEFPDVAAVFVRGNPMLAFELADELIKRQRHHGSCWCARRPCAAMGG